MKNKYSAAILCLVLALSFSVGHFYFGWRDYVLEQAPHDAALSEYKWHWLSTTFENFTSEMGQLCLQFLLIAGAFKLGKKIAIHAYEKDAEEMKTSLAEIKLTLASMVNK